MDIKGLSFAELKNLIAMHGFPSYRANQIYEWLYRKQAGTWNEMTNLPLEMRQALEAGGIHFQSIRRLSQAVADDGTIKYLFGLNDGHTIESVYLPEPDRKTVCLSPQAGCGMGCLFCATGQMGLNRNLTVGEIVDQPLQISKLNQVRIDNLVIMGQGEPFANYEAVLKAIRLFNDERAFGIGARHITLSTCGLTSGIMKLAEESLQVNLAVSLHAADNELRDHLMPINKRYPLSDLIAACRHYLAATGRRITFEYVMIAGINDRTDDLTKLGQLLKGLLCHVNLIPFNRVPQIPFQASKPERIREFAAVLKDKWHIETTVRKERGASLAAACGQLQGKWLEQQK